MTTSDETSPKTAVSMDWHKVAEPGGLQEGRVMSAKAGNRTVCLSHFNGKYAAMDNRCPHQGGPLGEGSIERGVEGQCWIRCPWHGWDFDPLTGKPPGGHEDSGQETFKVEVRDDGIYVGLPPEPQHERTVTDVVAETLVNWGVTSVFGMVGHSNLGLSDAIRRQTVAGGMNYYGIRHEGAASFACSGYAKLTRKPAACLAIAGPGATNLMTGLWDARVDRAPVIALTGQVQVQVFGPGTFQDIDLAAAFAPVSVFSKSLLPGSDPAELTSLACKAAIDHNDVAHLIFPDDVQTVPADTTMSAGTVDGRLSIAPIVPTQDRIDELTAALAESERPLIIVGFGARDAMPDIVEFADHLGAPVATTFKAKGQISDAHPLAAGVLGRSGTPIASWFMNECDLILALGTSFSKHTGIEPSKTTIQIDVDPSQLSRFHAVDMPVHGEVGATLSAIQAGVPRRNTKAVKSEVAERWAIWRAEKASRLDDDQGLGLNSARVFDVLSGLVPGNAVIAVDVGNNTYSFGRYFECDQQSVLMSGYLGSIGFSFPAAMGAWAATQEPGCHEGRPVVSISGDGGFGQYAWEFTTAVKYGMNITHILLNNGQLGKISKEQRAGDWEVWQTELVNPSFAAFARACGGMGKRVKAASELEDALREALAHDGPSLVEIMTDAELI